SRLFRSLGSGAWPRSPNSRWWLGGGHESWSGPSMSTQWTARPGPVYLVAFPGALETAFPSPYGRIETTDRGSNRATNSKAVGWSAGASKYPMSPVVWLVTSNVTGLPELWNPDAQMRIR